MLQQRVASAQATTAARVEEVATSVPPDYADAIDALDLRIEALETA